LDGVFQTFGIVLPNLLRTVFRIHGCAGAVTILSAVQGPEDLLARNGAKVSGKSSREDFECDRVDLAAIEIRVTPCRSILDF
jgi:hypothetical protein